MKRIALFLLALVLLAATAVSFAEPTAWYEISAEDTVLTVRLPGEDWLFEISNPEALELITMETNEGFIASFMSTANAQNTVSLILRRAENEAVAAEEIRVLEINATEANKLSVNAVLVSERAAEWVELDEEEIVLTVRLPGEDWSFEVVEPIVCELLTLEANDGAFVASFTTTMEEFGHGQLVFAADDGLEYRAVDVFGCENGELSVTRVEVFEIFVPAEIAE